MAECVSVSVCSAREGVHVLYCEFGLSEMFAMCLCVCESGSIGEYALCLSCVCVCVYV